MAAEQTQESSTVEHQDLQALIQSDYDYTQPKRKEIREAVIVAVEESQVIVDLGAKRDGIVPSRDLDRLEDDYRNSLKVGDTVPVYVMDVSGREDGIIVSLNMGLAQRDWLRAKELLESGKTSEATVRATNRGGVVVGFGRLRGFVPNSHLTSVPRGLRGDQLQEAKSKLAGKTIKLAVIEVDQRQRRLVLSERVARRRRQSRIFEELSPGDVVTGAVSNVVSYGAFVDLGGVDGLVHISELDWRHVKEASEVVNVGDEIQVYVLDIDPERRRIGLSRKRLLPDPWPIVTEDLIEGQTIEGTITKVVSFGAFVDVGDGIEGLIHVSEMPDEEATRASLVPGTQVQVRILRIDAWKRRISLSMRNVEQPTTTESSQEPNLHE
jgi:small subunit ribosomal protein S1